MRSSNGNPAPGRPSALALGAARTGGRGYRRLVCQHCRSTGHLRSSSHVKRKCLAIGIGYLGRKALRREQCDVHAVGLMSQQRRNELLGNDQPLNNVKAVFSTGSVPRLYNSEAVENSSQSHVTTNNQSVCKSWIRAPSGVSWPDINFGLTFTGLPMSGAPSDERLGLSFVVVIIRPLLVPMFAHKFEVAFPGTHKWHCKLHMVTLFIYEWFNSTFDSIK
jgi:hypothetical protein